MRFSQAFLDEVLARTSIVDVVGKRVSWDARKSNARKGDYWACCPFHGEKSPSFHAEEAKGRFYCFGCQKKGNAIDFVMETDKLSFPEAVERLALDAGLALPARTPGGGAEMDRRASLAQALEAAQRFFASELMRQRGATARDYLIRKRGLTPADCERFGLGYAPDSRTALRDSLMQAGLAMDLLVDAGLLVTPDDGGAPFDRFRHRVMFPITDPRGRIVGFGARALSDSAQAKYLNSPETPLFDKGRLLYRFAPARQAAAERKAQGVVVAEGYMDVIALERAGFAAVAPLGTALTEDQIALLWKAGPEPILCLDGDAAGQRAAARAIDRALPLLKPGRTLRFATLPQDADPDDLLTRDGPAAMAAVLAGARPLVEVLFERERALKPLDTPEARADFRVRLRRAVATIADPDVRAAYGQDIRERLDALFGSQAGQARAGWTGAGARLPAARRRDDTRFAPRMTPAQAHLQRTTPVPRSPPKPRDQQVLDLLVGCIGRPHRVRAAAEELGYLPIRSEPLRRLRQVLLDNVESEQAIDLATVRRHLQQAAGHESVRVLDHASDPKPPPEKEDAESRAARLEQEADQDRSWLAALGSLVHQDDLAREVADSARAYAASEALSEFDRQKKLKAEEFANLSRRRLKED